MIETYITNKCKFVAKDSEMLEPSEDHVFIEFLVGKHIDSNSSLQISDSYQDYRFDLHADGSVSYYKLEISTISDGTNVYWDGEQLWKGSELISDVSLIPEYMQSTQFGIGVIGEEHTFSICNLQRCVIELQRKAIFDGLKACNIGKCDKVSAIKQQRDFLFISLLVLENLICQEKFVEAQSILDNLSSCNSLCADFKLKSNCNCNG